MGSVRGGTVHVGSVRGGTVHVGSVKGWNCACGECEVVELCMWGV